MSSRLVERLQAARRLVFYDGVLRDGGVVQALVGLLEALADAEAGPASAGPAGERIWQAARELTARLLARSETEGRSGPSAPASPPWSDALVEAILTDANPFSQEAARCDSLDRLPAALRQAAAPDWRCLQALAPLPPSELEGALLSRGLPWPQGLWAVPSPAARGTLRPRRDLVESLHAGFARASDFAACLEDLAAYYRAVGPGVVGRYAVLRWDGTRLSGIPHPDPVRLEHLVGYEREREQVVRNTHRFVAGAPAHHLLLYGPRGTGKSATVKALAAAFADRGLRLVELRPADLDRLPHLLETLRPYRQRFVVFIDDVSFGEADAAFKELKATLEGSARACPPNVRVYATSNRRHLVREQALQDGAARPQDELNETLSLADRFGVTVFFPPCDQALYLRIVEGVARQAGVVVAPTDAPPTGQGPWRPIQPATLHKLALEWAMRHNDRSPRTAVQFVAELAGELGLSKPEA
ncbi:MAG: ATP-binding protein [Firmicutes bacterium]|nr:ATP-binding protein [Bacillota bacterium]